MVARVFIEDGVPFWLSPSIVPSKDLPQSIITAPTLANVSMSSTDVYVYVKVENTGTQDLGVCSCPTGPWIPAGNFSESENSTNISIKPSPNGLQSVLLDAVGGDILIIGAGNYALSGPSIPNPHHRAWGWSPDGRFLGYVRTAGNVPPVGMNSDWKLSVFALQPFTDSDGTVFSPGDEIVSKESGAVWSWTNYFFRWAGSKAVLALGPNDPDHPLQANNADVLEWHALCPSAPAFSKVWGMPALHKIGTLGTLSKWTYLVSPCESYVAFAANMSAGGQAFITLLSAEWGIESEFKINNVPGNITTNGPYPAITTDAHTAQGVTIKRGDGIQTSTIMVDDPECIAISETVQVVVDRVKASTLPTANLGVLQVGNASAGSLFVGNSTWVQVPNFNNWANQGEEHWCLLAQAFTMDGTTIPRPWNGQAPSPPPFPVGDENCAQRNIMISP